MDFALCYKKYFSFLFHHFFRRKGSTVIVKIVDKCPGCKRGDLDLSTKSFKSIAELQEGRVPITWETVPCDVKGSVQVHVSDCNDWYIALQIRNHPNGIKAVKIKTQNEDWSPNLTRRKDNHFTLSKKLQFPLSVMITDVTGQTLIIEDMIGICLHFFPIFNKFIF